MLTQDAQLQLILDLVGVFVFALSGGLVAVRKRLDLFGVLVLAGAAALGGGVMRDLLIGATPPVGLSDWRLVATASLAGVVTFLFHPGVARISKLVRILDAAGLAAFAVAGALKALGAGAGPMTAVLVGAITAIGGGMLRDLLAGQVPEVLRRELYAVPALLGATVVVVAYRMHHLTETVVWSAVTLVFTVRMTAVVLDLNAPTPLRTGDSA
ncbi:trimeric intracellular cation channel family protein [Oryzihumus sp.]